MRAAAAAKAIGSASGAGQLAGELWLFVAAEPAAGLASRLSVRVLVFASFIAAAAAQMRLSENGQTVRSGRLIRGGSLQSAAPRRRQIAARARNRRRGLTYKAHKRRLVRLPPRACELLPARTQTTQRRVLYGPSLRAPQASFAASHLRGPGELVARRSGGASELVSGRCSH